MTVNELMDELSKYPAEAPVRIIRTFQKVELLLLQEDLFGLKTYEADIDGVVDWPDEMPRDAILPVYLKGGDVR